MPSMEISIFSTALRKMTKVNVIMPQPDTEIDDGVPEEERKVCPYKSLYLLHGLSDDYSAWCRRTSIERYADKYGIAVIMPDAARSFYTNGVYCENYYDYISWELPQIMQRMFPLSRKREDNNIAGFSMGGYGALKTALRNPGKYRAVAALSAVADINGFLAGDDKLRKTLFGDAVKVPDEDDLFYLAGNCPSPRPKIYMGMGTEDRLHDSNLPLCRLFTDLGYDFIYRESSGRHDWAFWDEYIQYILKWMFD